MFEIKKIHRAYNPVYLLLFLLFWYSKSADLLRKSLLSTLRFGRCKTNIHWMFCTSYLACPKFKSLIVQARTAFWPFDPGIIWCWGQKVFCPQLMPTNCSAAKQLPQFYKHEKSADLLHKSLLSTLRFGRCKTNIHWMFCTSCLAGPKFKSLIMQAWTAFWPFDPGIIL